jgi:hypothetical protein
MGYSTYFDGELRFKTKATPDQLAALEKLCSATFNDCEPDFDQRLYYLDLKVNAAETGLAWNGAEKTYEMAEQVNAVLAKMREQWPDFGLHGQLDAQGEYPADRWALRMGADGWAHKDKLAVAGKVVTCPHCRGRFALEE